MSEPFDRWLDALEARQLADLTFSELSRSLRALSSTYVERRSKIGDGAALSGAGKRAAFALFYGPLHFLLVRHVVAALGAPFTSVQTVLDLGCGTGASGAGWAMACTRAPRITAVDRHPWAIEEARRTFRDLGLTASFRVDDLTRTLDPAGTHDSRKSIDSRRANAHGARARRSDAILLAFAVNEIADAAARDIVLTQLLEHAASGGHVVVVEPLAGFVAPWWGAWQRAFEQAGGRADEWRIRTTLPPIIEKLDRAAGLNHREIKARSLAV